MDEQCATPPEGADQAARTARPQARRSDRTYTPPAAPSNSDGTLTLLPALGGASLAPLAPSVALGRLLGLASLYVIQAPLAADNTWSERLAAMIGERRGARPGLGDAILVAPARASTDVEALIAARRAGQSQQASFLNDAQPTPVAIEVVVGLIGQRDGAFGDDAGVLAWQVTERQAYAAQRVLNDEAGIQTTPAGAVGFAALVRALLADRQLPVRARRFPREPTVVVVTSHDAEDTAGLLLASRATEPAGRGS